MTTPFQVADYAQDVSPTTARARSFVEVHLAAAVALGANVADHIQDPDAMAAVLRRGLAALADPEYLAGQQFVAPGIGQIHGVRRPLLDAVLRTFKRATRHDRPTSLLFLAERLYREPHLEARWIAFALLSRTLAVEPERTWQLLRRGAREAADWITVDDLAHPYAAGIAAEPYRWAELEQLVFSPSRWERRLVGSTIAMMTHRNARSERGAEIVAHAVPLIGQLMGDAEPDVQKALSWAYRSLAAVDRRTTTDALRSQTAQAVAEHDGHRTWVIRDSLAKLDPLDAEALRADLSGIRKRPGAPSTSFAAATAARFGDLPDPTSHPEPPLA